VLWPPALGYSRAKCPAEAAARYANLVGLEEDPAYFTSLTVKSLDWKRGNLLVWSLLPGLFINLFQSVDKDKNGMGSRAWDAPSFFQHSCCTTSTQLSLALS